MIDQIEACVQAVQNGDTEAFSFIVTHFQAGFINLAWSYFQNREDALEMTQDLFLHLFKKIDHFSGKSTFRTWAYTVARNFFYKKYRKRKIKTQSLDQTPPLAIETNTNQDQFVKDQLRQSIEDSLLSLPEKYATPIRLFYYEDMSYKEIAEIMGKPINTIKTYFFQGRKMLRTKLIHLGLEWEE